MGLIREFSQEDLQHILSKGEREGGRVRFELSFVTYHAAERVHRLVEARLYGFKGFQIGDQINPLSPLNGQVEGHFLLNPGNFEGELFIRNVPHNPNWKDVVSPGALPPNNQTVFDFLNYQNPNKRVSIYTRDLDDSTWSLHCSFI